MNQAHNIVSKTCLIKMFKMLFILPLCQKKYEYKLNYHHLKFHAAVGF